MPPRTCRDLKGRRLARYALHYRRRAANMKRGMRRCRLWRNIRLRLRRRTDKRAAVQRCRKWCSKVIDYNGEIKRYGIRSAGKQHAAQCKRRTPPFVRALRIHPLPFPIPVTLREEARPNSALARSAPRCSEGEERRADTGATY